MNRAENKQQEIIDEFLKIKSWEDRYKKIISIGKELKPLSENLYDDKYLVKGCQSQVWLFARLNEQGEMIIEADSDALIVKGLVALLKRGYSELTPQEILETQPRFIQELGFQEYLSPSRANGFVAMVKQIKLYAQVFKLSEIK
jgi:cysteine desulfuration protein SufE